MFLVSSSLNGGAIFAVAAAPKICEIIPHFKARQLAILALPKEQAKEKKMFKFFVDELGR